MTQNQLNIKHKPKRIVGYAARQKNGWWHTYRFLVLRRSLQVAILAAFTWPFFGFWILKGSLAASEFLGFIPLSDPFIFLQALSAGQVYALSGIIGVILLAFTYWLLGGRSYCAWVCPINIVTDMAQWLRVKLKFKNHISLPRQARFWIMLMVLFVSFLSHSIVWELINPITAISRSIIYLSLNISSISLMLVFIVFILDSVVANRLWCGHLCPVGSFYKLLGTKTPLYIEASKQSACDDCADCYKVCPEFQVIKPALKTAELRILDADCTRCGRCIDICHANVFEFKWNLKSPPKITH